MHRTPLKLVTKSCIAHDGLLASSLGKKVSTNLGAIQTGTDGLGLPQHA